MANVLSEYGNLVGISDSPNKADKVSNAVSGNFAGLDANGNLTDSGFESADFEPALTLTETTLTGNPIVVDGKKLAVSTKITFDPIQAGSGDPSPSNVRAISGYNKVELNVCERNIWNEKTRLGTYNASTGEYDNSYNDRLCNINPILVAPQCTYFFRTSPANTGGNVYFYDSKMEYIDKVTGVGNNTFTTPANCIYINISLGSAYGSTYNNDVGIMYPHTANGYKPYTTITDISQSLPETIYGGTLDVESGVLTVTRKRIDMGNLAWNYGSGSQVFNVSIPDKKDGNAHFVCEIYKDGGTAGYSVGNKEIAWNNGVNYRKFAFVRDTDYSTKETFTTAVTGKYLVYDLAEPYTLQLTPSQVRLLTTQSVVTSNGSSIELTVSNTKVASIEAVDSVKESVDALGGYISACKPGDAVDLIPYTSSTNTYQFPCDGYVYLNGRNNTSGYIRALLYGRVGGIMVSLGMNITGVQERQSVFVRKGMRCYIETNIADTSTIIAQYKPFISL